MLLALRVYIFVSVVFGMGSILDVILPLLQPVEGRHSRLKKRAVIAGSRTSAAVRYYLGQVLHPLDREGHMRAQELDGSKYLLKVLH